MDISINGNQFLKITDNFKKQNNIKSKLIFKQHMENKPYFSIAIPTYNRIETLKEAIDSALNQNWGGAAV